MRIELIGLVVFGHHGYLEEERRLGQRFIVDLWADVRGDATETDRIEDTVDYRKLAALVRAVFRTTRDPYAVLVSELMAQQTQAERAAEAWTAWMERFPTVESVRVRVRKPDVVLDPPVDYAAAIVERSRA